MRAQTYRPRVQNGPITKRSKRPVAAKSSERRASARRAPQRGRGSNKRKRQEGSNLFMSLIIIGALVVAGFVFALRSQINARQLGQAETKLRAELDEIANRQRYEVLERQRVMSMGESDRAAQTAGLVQPRFNQPKAAAQAAAAQKPAPRGSKSRKESYSQRQSERLAQRR